MNVSREEIKMMLDRMAASIHLNLEESVALNDGRLFAARYVLARMGLNPADEICRTILNPVEMSGQQKLLVGQRLSVRSAAVKRARSERRVIWTGLELE